MNNLVIRVVAIVSLASMLALVLYLPAAHPPSHFIAQIRAEHQQAVEVFGPERAARILTRMLDMQTPKTQVSAVPAGLQIAPGAPGGVAASGGAYVARGAHDSPIAPAASGVNAAMAAQIGQMGQRLFSNPYFQSIDALFALAEYRFSVWLETLKVLLLFGLVALIDGLVVRVVRSKVFVQHSPELFALHASLAIMVACGTVVAFVLPLSVHPYWLSVSPLLIGMFMSHAVSNYHRRA